jgi:hypothetical protein
VWIKDGAEFPFIIEVVRNLIYVKKYAAQENIIGFLNKEVD